MNEMTAKTTAGASAGEEFHVDLRVARESVAAEKRAGLPGDVVKRLNKIDPVKSTIAVLHTVGVTVALIGVAVYFWTWWAVIPAVLLIATRQQAFFVLAHDAAHYRMYETRWLNDLVGRAIGTAVGISMCSYRVVHRLHHNHLYEPVDPDLPIHAGYPRGRAYLMKKLAKDLLGGTAFKTYAYFFGNPALNSETGTGNRPLDDTSPALRAAARQDRWTVLAFHVLAPAVAFASGYGWHYLVLWALPLVTILQPILRFRAICEHGMVRDHGSPLTAARTNTGSALVRWLIFPHHVHYHVEHHMYPAIPHYNLPEAHREMAARGLLDGAEVRPFLETARMAFGERAKTAG